jgi:hypothetical protein
MRRLSFIAIVLFGLALGGCQRIKKEVIQSFSPKSFVSSYREYDGEYKTASLKVISLDLPIKASVYSETFDGFGYNIMAKDDNVIYEILAIPFELKQEDAYEYLETRTRKVFRRSSSLQPFKDGDITGVYAVLADEDSPLLCGESFFFDKNGFSFYILCFGPSKKFYSTFDIIRSIQPLIKPDTEGEKQFVVKDITSKYEKRCVVHINETLQLGKYNGLFNRFYCSDVELFIYDRFIDVKCILEGDYSQLYPGHQRELHNILLECSHLEPFGDYFKLLGYNISIGFYKPSGEKIKLDTGFEF